MLNLKPNLQIMVLEICANSYQSAFNAQRAGAHRIELCSELAVGGITPSYGLLNEVMKGLAIPVFVLIRPRSGHFSYTSDEFEIMKRDIQLCKEMGCAGIVSGVLNADQTIYRSRLKELIELSKPLSFTFHRAFDWVPNPLEALEELKELGVDRVLTSGQQASAEKGLPLLTKLKELAKNRITILPGGGINACNAALFQTAGFEEIHASASTIKQVLAPPSISMNSPSFFDETVEAFSDPSKIEAILKVLKS